MNARPLVHFFCPCMPGSPARREVHAMSPNQDAPKPPLEPLPKRCAAVLAGFPFPDRPTSLEMRGGSVVATRTVDPGLVDAEVGAWLRKALATTIFAGDDRWIAVACPRKRTWTVAVLDVGAVCGFIHGEVPAVEPPPHGSTAEEKEVAALLGRAWDAFILLPDLGPQDREEFRRSISLCQMLVSHRLAVRVDPEFWVP